MLHVDLSYLKTTRKLVDTVLALFVFDVTETMQTQIFCRGRLVKLIGVALEVDSNTGPCG